MRLLRRPTVPEPRSAPIEESQDALAKLTLLVEQLKDQNARLVEATDRITFFFVASDLQGLDPKKFEAFGGVQGVKRAVNLLYSQVMTDPDLAPYFQHTNMARIQQRQVEMFLAIFGIREYRGVRLGAVHEHLGITSQHYEKLVGYIMDVLDLMGLDSKDQAMFLASLEGLKGEIVHVPEGLPA